MIFPCMFFSGQLPGFLGDWEPCIHFYALTIINLYAIYVSKLMLRNVDWKMRVKNLEASQKLQAV